MPEELPTMSAPDPRPPASRPPLALLLLAAFALGGCGSSNNASSGGGGGGGGGTDLPPNVTASPAGGWYADDLSVTLFASEPATIHYTTDGSTPSAGSPSTTSGPAPIAGIPLQGAPDAESVRLLRYYGVDLGGQASAVVTTQYVIDKLAPAVYLQGAPPAPVGIFDQAPLVWGATDDGSYVVELGGDGTPGSGTAIATGLYTTPGLPVTTLVPGGSLAPDPAGSSLHVYVTDAAGNQGVLASSVALRDFGSFELPSGIVDIAIAPGPVDPLELRFYAVAAGRYALLVHDPDDGASVAEIPLATEPSGLALTADGRRAFVGVIGGIAVVDTELLEVETTIPIQPLGVPTGLALTPDGSSLYFCASNRLQTVDTANLALLPPSTTIVGIQSCRIAFVPLISGARGVLAWKYFGQYGVRVFSASDGSPLGTPIEAVPIDPPGELCASASASFPFAFAGEYQNRLARISLDPPELQGFTDRPAFGQALLPGDGLLLATRDGSRALEFLSPADFAPVLVYKLDESVSGLSRRIAFERLVQGATVVTRTFVVEERPGAKARVWRLPLGTAPL